LGRKLARRAGRRAGLGGLQTGATNMAPGASGRDFWRGSMGYVASRGDGFGGDAPHRVAILAEGMVPNRGPDHLRTGADALRTAGGSTGASIQGAEFVATRASSNCARHP